MAEILDNQEVTTETLNNIAIDLGATTFNGFPENKFGVDELNNITKTLVSKGITQGANRCKPYLSGSDLYINTGTIIFATGAKIRITSPQKVTAEAGTYIYALNDTSRNIAEITVSETKPTTGDFVMLAYLDADSTLTDMREFSKANVALSAAQAIYSESITASFNGNAYTELKTIDNNQEYSMFMAETASSTDKRWGNLVDNDISTIIVSDVYISIKKEGTKYIISGKFSITGSGIRTITIYLA